MLNTSKQNISLDLLLIEIQPNPVTKSLSHIVSHSSPQKLTSMYKFKFTR